MLTLNNVSTRFGAKILFEEVTCTFLSGRHYAISGPHGAGKSTLMGILTGDIEPSKGSVTRPKKLGGLRQDQFAFDEYRVMETDIIGVDKLLSKTLFDCLRYLILVGYPTSQRVNCLINALTGQVES